MEQGELLQLACDSLHILSKSVIKFGVGTDPRRRISSEDCKLSALGSQLFIIVQRLEGLDDSGQVVSSKKLRKLLCMLEQICTFHSTSNTTRASEFGTLRALARSEIDPRFLEPNFRKVVSNDVLRTSCTANLAKFLPSQDLTFQRAEINISEYPGHVYDGLFAAIKRYSECACQTPLSHSDIVREHHGSLGLRHDAPLVDNDLEFDTVFSVAQTHTTGFERDWRRLKIQVPKSKGHRRSAKVEQDTSKIDQIAISGGLESKVAFEYVDPLRFCDILLKDHGPIHQRMRAVDGSLSLIGNPVAADGPTLREGAISLRNAIQISSLTAYEKLSLAHIIAKSFWEYYESPWMCRRWTESDIHFIPAERPGRKEKSWYGPFIPMVFSQIDKAGIIHCEYLEDEMNVIHRAPRVLALGTVLVAILRGEAPPARRDYGTETAMLNSEFVAYSHAIKEGDWPGLAHLKPNTRKEVLQAVDACFDADAFKCNSTTSERRRLILKRIVSPLEDAVAGGSSKRVASMWVSEGSFSGPLYATSIKDLDLPVIQRPQKIPRSSRIPAVAKGSFYDSAEADMSHDMSSRADNFIQTQIQVCNDRIGDIITPDQPVRIAILDTGIDTKHPNFRKNPCIRKVRNWTGDYKNNPFQVQDEYGHGTHVAGIVLSIAPHADLYIARVANEVPEYPAIIAKALDYATSTWDVDIVVMSFGFESENGIGCTELKTAIRNAYVKGVLMFAAASNEGANRPRAFPARHSVVFGVHSTDGKGVPSGFNPLTKENDHNFSTLGEGVESAWPKALTKNPWTMRRSGTSYATPIAASIAAFILLYSRIYLDPETAEKVKEFDNMQRILKATSRRSGGYEYLSLDTMFGPHRDMMTIKGDLQEIVAGTYRER